MKKGLVERMLSGEFLVSAQIDPPATSDAFWQFRVMINKLNSAGVKLLDINSSRRVSYDSIQLAAWLKNQGFDVIPHVTTRDSSINGLANQILGAHTLSFIDNFLVITGDPHEDKTAMVASEGVFQADSVGALRLLNDYLRKKQNLNFSFAAAINQNTVNLSAEAVKTLMKQDAGVNFFMSQPVFNEFQLKRLLYFNSYYSNKPLIVGIWPLVNQKTIEAIKNGIVVGVEISDDVYEESKNYWDDEKKLTEWGLSRALELIKQLKEKKGSVCGAYIVAPARNPLLLLDLVPKI